MSLTLEELEAAILRIDAKLDEVKHLLEPETLTIAEVCEKYLRRSTEWARVRPWALPPQDPANPHRYRREECEEYYSIPLQFREEQYRAKLRKESA